MIVAAAAAMHLSLLPIAPLILLPFALVFFVIVSRSGVLDWASSDCFCSSCAG